MSELACPCCDSGVYDTSYKGTRVYKCTNPMGSCELNSQWHEDHGDDEYRTPLGTTAAQVRRVYAEFSERDII